MTRDPDGVVHCCGCVVTTEFCDCCGEFIPANVPHLTLGAE